MELFGSMNVSPSASIPVKSQVKAPVQSAANDLLGDLFGDGKSTSSTAPRPTSKSDPLGDLFGSNISSSTKTATNKAYTCYSKNGLLITMVPSRVPSSTKVDITAHFTNSGGSPISSLAFQVAVPKSLKLLMNPPSNTTISPGGKETQTMKIDNPSKVLP